MLVTVFEIVQVEGFLIKSLVWEAVMKCHCINLKTREAGRQGIASGGCSCLPVFTSTHWYQKILHCSVICTEAVHSFAKTIVSIYQLILGKNLAWFHSYLFPQKKSSIGKRKDILMYNVNIHFVISRRMICKQYVTVQSITSLLFEETSCGGKTVSTLDSTLSNERIEILIEASW